MRLGTTVVTAVLLVAILGAAVVQFVLLVDCPGGVASRWPAAGTAAYLA